MEDKYIVVDSGNVAVLCGEFASKKGTSFYACKVVFTDARSGKSFWKVVSFDLPEIARICGLSVGDFIKEISK